MYHDIVADLSPVSVAHRPYVIAPDAFAEQMGALARDGVRAVSLSEAGVCRAGMEIGTHSLTHRPPAALSAAEIDHELRESRRILEEGLGVPVRTGSAPTGFHNPMMGPAARAAGYQALCVSRIGLWQPGVDAFDIPRVPVKADTSLELFMRLARGESGPLRRLRASQAVRNALKRGLGVGPYLRLRRALLGMRNQAG
jgi:peptidoglycan/xylan/chitin deacetylase (PgdA/CDA1 family)